MISEAKKAGLQIDDERISAVLEGVPTDPSLDTPHESLVGPWKLAEYCWKHVWNSSTQKHEWKRGHRLPRIIQPGALIDRSVLSRLRAPAANYDPKNLSSAFKQQVRDLASVPATLEYDS